MANIELYYADLVVPGVQWRTIAYSSMLEVAHDALLSVTAHMVDEATPMFDFIALRYISRCEGLGILGDLFLQA